jgi:transposase
MKPAKGSKPEKPLLNKLYVKESKSIRETAESLGCTKDMVYRSLKEYGIETRTNRRRSKLKDIKISILEKEVKRKGIRGYARELGVDESTLRHHLNTRRISGQDAGYVSHN